MEGKGLPRIYVLLAGPVALSLVGIPGCLEARVVTLWRMCNGAASGICLGSTWLSHL